MIVFLAGLVTLWASPSTESREPWSFYIWPAIWLFVVCASFVSAGKRRTIWSLATSMMFFRLTDAAQAEVLEDLSRRPEVPSRKGSP